MVAYEGPWGTIPKVKGIAGGERLVKLEELVKGTVVDGVEPDGPVTVVNVEWNGTDSVEVFYKDVSGGPGSQLLYRFNEARMKILGGAEEWAFDGDGRFFRLAAEAKRIKMAYLFDPLLAVHTSLVDPYPHQISAVYERMLRKQPLRFLLADDPGAGKTIMAGLLMKELVARGDLERCMVVCPGSLVEQWQDELWQKFMLPFEIVAREQIEASRTGNPFAETNLVICRLDHLSRNEGVKEMLKGTEWDLIVVDEAHKMSASFSGGEINRTKRYGLGELLSGLTRHFLLMSATPHNGKEEDFQLFMRLLDQDRFEGRFRQRTRRANVSDLMRRMIKEDLRKFDGTKLFPERYAHTVGYNLSSDEANLYEEVTDYVRREFNRAEAAGGRVRTVGFALTILQRRLASSPEAIYRSLVRRRERLEEKLREARIAGRVATDARLNTLTSTLENYEDELPGEELEEAEEEVVDLATASANTWELEQEIATLRRLEGLAARVRAGHSDRKWEQLRRLLVDEDLMFHADGHPRKLIVFTEHRDTLGYLERKLKTLRGDGAVVTISGGMRRGERHQAQERFLGDPEVTILLATDAAGEGVNLQRASLMVNYDLPWNPNRLEQRFGRIHRIGQTEECHLWNLVAEDTREGEVYYRLLKKLETARKALQGKVFDVLGELFREKPLRELLIEAVRSTEGRSATRRKVTSALDAVMEQRRLEALINEQALTHEAISPETLGRIRSDMERAEARRLQPHFVASFFVEAARLFGARPREAEPGRYELKKVPDRIYDRARRLPGGARIHHFYERVTFEKSKRNVKGKPQALFLYPGHPLVDAAVDLVLEKCGEALSRGAALVDEKAPGTEPRLLVLLEHEIRDGRKNGSGEARTASRRMQFVELRANGEASSAGFAPHLDYRPLRKEEHLPLERLGPLPSDAGERARRHAAEKIVPEHLEELRSRREIEVKKVREAVKERLNKEISHWDSRLGELWDEVGRDPSVRVTINNLSRRRDTLAGRLERRMQELDRELHLMPSPLKVIGAALVVPADLLTGGASGNGRPGTFARDPDAIRRVESLAMQAVIMTELDLGNVPRDVSKENRGYDLESQSAEDGSLRMLEVKGRAEGAKSVTVTRNEIVTAMNRPEDYILAIVEIAGDAAREPRYVRRPFGREPEFNVHSVNYDLTELLSRSETPG